MIKRLLKNWIFFVLPASLLLSSCHPNASFGHDVDLLTRTPWKYEKAGFDSNKDGVFDALDPRIAGCENDNTIVFRPDGTGLLEEGLIKCKPADPDSLPFMWAFQDNDSTIYFQDQYYRIRALNSDRFEIYADQNMGGISTRYIIIFKH
jgi:hypothetical protein